MSDETEVASVTARYPPADITPAEFERFVAELFSSAATEVEDLEVRVLDTIKGVDGSYVFDATVRFTVAGLQMLVVVEAKRHGRSVERSYVQILHDKLRSVGAHKAVLVSTASFQRGALDYAGVHWTISLRVGEARALDGIYAAIAASGRGRTVFVAGDDRGGRSALLEDWISGVGGMRRGRGLSEVCLRRVFTRRGSAIGPRRRRRL